MINRPRTVNRLIENDDYFVADLDNGGVRFGLKGCMLFDVPAYHADYNRVRALTLDNIEDTFDEFVGRN
jgi:hypothetical protein